MSQPAAMVLDLHALNAREYARDIVVIDNLQHELNIGQHDVGCAARDQVEAIALFLTGLDFAFCEFAPQLMRRSVLRHPRLRAARET